MGKKRKKDKVSEGAITITSDDIERAVLTYFAAKGMGLDADPGSMEAASNIALARSEEYSDMLDYLVREAK